MSHDKSQKDSKASGSIDQTLINDLATLLKDNELTEIEVEHQGLRVRVARQIQMSAQAFPMTQAQPLPAAMAAPVPIAEAPAAAEPAADLASNPGTLKSPMVGTIYLAADPKSAPYVREGDKVSEGQTVMIVEAMKTMNYIPAHKSGTVKRILVANEQPVEYNEPLLVIE